MIIPVLLLSLSGQPHAANIPVNGPDLIYQCQAAKRLLDNPLAASEATALAAGSCFDYLMGFIEAGELAKFFCPSTVAPATLARMYAAYMEKNPKLLDRPRGEGALLSLADAYPCQTHVVPKG